MKESHMRVHDPNELLLQLFGITLSVKGVVAICVMSIPIALLLTALAWRIAGGNLKPKKSPDKPEKPPILSP